MTPEIDETTVVATEAARISGLGRSCDLTTPVGHLGRWKIRDVVAHLGGVHRWATRIITTRSTDGPSFTKSKLDGPKPCDWFDDGAEALLEAFRANDRDEACPNFNPGSANTIASRVSEGGLQSLTLTHPIRLDQPRGGLKSGV